MIAIEYLFLSLSVASGSAKSAFSKLLSPYSKTSAHFGFTNTVLSLTAAMILYFLNGGNVDIEQTKNLLLGILFGIFGIRTIVRSDCSLRQNASDR